MSHNATMWHNYMQKFKESSITQQRFLFFFLNLFRDHRSDLNRIPFTLSFRLECVCGRRLWDRSNTKVTLMRQIWCPVLRTNRKSKLWQSLTPKINRVISNKQLQDYTSVAPLAFSFVLFKKPQGAEQSWGRSREGNVITHRWNCVALVWSKTVCLILTAKLICTIYFQTIKDAISILLLIYLYIFTVSYKVWCYNHHHYHHHYYLFIYLLGTFCDQLR